MSSVIHSFLLCSLYQICKSNIQFRNIIFFYSAPTWKCATWNELLILLLILHPILFAIRLHWNRPKVSSLILNTIFGIFGICIWTCHSMLPCRLSAYKGKQPVVSICCSTCEARSLLFTDQKLIFSSKIRSLPE